jgi:hypothetical protein
MWYQLYSWYGLSGPLFNRKVIINSKKSGALTTNERHNTSSQQLKPGGSSSVIYVAPLRREGDALFRVEMHPLQLFFSMMDDRTGRPLVEENNGHDNDNDDLCDDEDSGLGENHVEVDYHGSSVKTYSCLLSLYDLKIEMKRQLKTKNHLIQQQQQKMKKMRKKKKKKNKNNKKKKKGEDTEKTEAHDNSSRENIDLKSRVWIKKRILPNSTSEKIKKKNNKINKNEYRLLLSPKKKRKTKQSKKQTKNTEKGEKESVNEKLLLLNNLDLVSGDTLMIETQYIDNDDNDDTSEKEMNMKNIIWPMDLLISKRKTFREHLNIDSKVDALDRENKWYR